MGRPRPRGEDTAPPLDGTAVIVTHDAGDRLGPLVDAVLDQVERVVVVDNDSVDGSLSVLEGKERTTVLRNDRNLGFAAAVNRGVLQATGAWLVLVNPDVGLRPGDVERLVEGLEPDVAAVAPLQVDERDVPRPESGGYDASLGRYLVWAVMPARWHRGLGPWLSPPFPQVDVELDWLSGALLAVRREIFERLGGFDERYFLYHEDVDFGRKARAAGYRLVLRPSVRLHHEVAHGDPARRVLYTQRSVVSLAADPRFAGWRRRVLGLVLALGFAARAVLTSGVSARRSRAVLPICVDLTLGREPRAPSPSKRSG